MTKTTKCSHCGRTVRADQATEVGVETTPFHTNEGKKILVGPVCYRLYYDRG